MSKWAKNAIIVVACADQGKGRGPEALGLAFHHQGPTFFNAYCQAATNVVDGGNDPSWPRRSVLSECFTVVYLDVGFRATCNFVCYCIIVHICKLYISNMWSDTYGKVFNQFGEFMQSTFTCMYHSLDDQLFPPGLRNVTTKPFKLFLCK